MKHKKSEKKITFSDVQVDEMYAMVVHILTRLTMQLKVGKMRRIDCNHSSIELQWNEHFSSDFWLPLKWLNFNQTDMKCFFVCQLHLRTSNFRMDLMFPKNISIFSMQLFSLFYFPHQNNSTRKKCYFRETKLERFSYDFLAFYFNWKRNKIVDKKLTFLVNSMHLVGKK